MAKRLITIAMMYPQSVADSALPMVNDVAGLSGPDTSNPALFRQREASISDWTRLGRSLVNGATLAAPIIPLILAFGAFASQVDTGPSWEGNCFLLSSKVDAHAAAMTAYRARCSLFLFIGAASGALLSDDCYFFKSVDFAKKVLKIAVYANIFAPLFDSMGFLSHSSDPLRLRASEFASLVGIAVKGICFNASALAYIFHEKSSVGSMILFASWLSANLGIPLRAQQAFWEVMGGVKLLAKSRKLHKTAKPSTVFTKTSKIDPVELRHFWI